MGFGQKIFLMSFTLIIIAINMIGIIMINNTYQSNIEKEIDKNILQINNIMKEAENGVDNLSNVSSIYLKNNVNIELYNEGEKIFTNSKEEYPEIVEKLFDEEDKLSIEELYKMQEQYVADENYINIYIKDDKLFTKMRENANVLVTISNISKINDMKQEQINYFIRLSLASSFVIALILSISVNLLTKKIKILNKTVKRVEKGDYSAKVKKLGNDEIGNVAKSFNKMTQAVQKNINDIQEVSENRKRFIGNLTHEIRTPLTSIIGYSSLIKNNKVQDKSVILEYCNKIHEEGKYIEKISQKLMDLLLIENGNIELETVNLSEELDKLVEELEQIFSNVTYEKEIENNVQAKIDKTLFKSLIFNLVKNAIKAYEEKPIVRLELSNNKQIKVIDYGKGIPSYELEKIKEPFYTLSKDRNRNFSGMGLGIPICIKIVEKLKGTLEIKSTENIGTTITIKLGEENEN